MHFVDCECALEMFATGMSTYALCTIVSFIWLIDAFNCMHPRSLSLSLSENIFFVRYRILYDKRFNAFHYPVTDEDAPNYRSIIQNPMDVATILHHVDNGDYITSAAFLQDINLIVSNAKACILCLKCSFFGWAIYILKMLHKILLIFKACPMFDPSFCNSGLQWRGLQWC